MLDTNSPELLPALLASVGDGVYVVAADGSVAFVNPAGLAILGYDDAEQLLGRPSHSTIHAHHRDGSPYPEEECPLLRPRQTGEAVQVDDDWFVRRDGSMVPGEGQVGRAADDLRRHEPMMSGPVRAARRPRCGDSASIPARTEAAWIF